MVRETRHLWVGNLPDNIREERIREHFKRYGRVQNVKLLGRPDNASTGVIGSNTSGICATVAFMDIKSASKAHNAEHVLDERTLTTEYYEPAAIPSTTGAPSAGSSPAGSGYSGSSSSVNSVPVPSTQRYQLSGGEDSSGATTCPIAASAAAPATWRGTNDSATDFCRRGNTPAAYGRYQRNNTNAPYSTPPSNVERTTPHHRWYASSERTGATGGESTPSTPGGGTESGRRRRHSGSASSRSDSSSPEPSDTSRASTPATQTPLSIHNNHRALPTAHQWASTASGRPLAICVRNLPTRSTDSSLKDGLYHEYKKHGKVVWVKVVGQNADRYAVVRFKKPSDVEKALEVSQDKLFFGCKISVAPHQSCDDDAESAKPYETDIDEYHPKATRTLFIGNLEKEVTQQQLRDKFKHFGRIIEIDIKKGSGGGAGYAFCQYASISSVVEAIRAMDGEYVGGSRVKLGFGKPVATACVWVDGLTEHTEKQVLGAVSRCGAATSVCVDRAAGAALVHFEQAAAAGAAVRELRRVAAAASAAEPDHPRLCVDYASRECQDAFYEQLEKHGGSAALAGSERLSGELSARYIPSTRHDTIRFDGCGSRSRASSYGRSTSRTPRYSTLEHYDPVDYAADRRYRVYEEQGSSPPPDDVPFEERLQSVVVSPHRARRHRRDSSPEDRIHSKERRRSSGGGVGVRRSRSGSGTRVHGARRRHRRRRDGSGSRSRAGTPLRDEPDAPPAEPRRPPRDRPPLPMCLPLPKFAAQLLRAAGPAPRPPPAPAPASPPRPPSASSSSAGEAPHSPSLEERIRSLDEKYEKWSGSRALSDAPDRARLRHRLLEVDINEVKPSEVVRSLLAKRSVFDEDSERLEGAVRAPSPTDTSRSRVPVMCQRSLRYSFTAQPPPPPPALLMSSIADMDTTDRPADPRLNRIERPCRIEKLCKISESDYAISRPRPRTPSTDRPLDLGRTSPPLPDLDSDSKSKSSPCTAFKIERKLSIDLDEKEGYKAGNQEKCIPATNTNHLVNCDKTPPVHYAKKPANDDQKFEFSKRYSDDNKCAREVMEMLLKKVEHSQRIESLVENKTKINKNHHSHSVEDYRPVPDSETNSDDKKHDTNKNKVAADCTLKEKDEAQSHNTLNPVKCDKEKLDMHSINSKYEESTSSILPSIKLEKENIQIDKSNLENEHRSNLQIEEKSTEDRRKDSERIKHSKERCTKDRYDSEKNKNCRIEKNSDKDKKSKEENSSTDNFFIDFVKTDKHGEKNHRDKNERENDKTRSFDDKFRNEHHRKDRKRDVEVDTSKQKKDDKNKSDKTKKDFDARRDVKKESDVKSRKSSRDESSRDISRKDSTDSSTSRASHDSSKCKDIENDTKEDLKPRVKLTDMFVKVELKKEPQNIKDFKSESITRIKSEIKEEKIISNSDNMSDMNIKPKQEVVEKQRHYSLDSPSESKRKERLNSCSSLPSNIGYKRRISSQDCFDAFNEDIKKTKNDNKIPERRDSKEARGDRHKTTKFNKGHFAKIIESKTKDDKKNQVKPPDDSLNGKDTKNTNLKVSRKSSKEETEPSLPPSAHEPIEETQSNLDFLALLELRSSEEDERQKALRKEMKEKKRLQQLQQIQELQMQQDAMQQIELMGKLKDDKKPKLDDKKREISREKRFSTDRKSRDEKLEIKRKNRKQVQSTDTSDSDEPKKHSIFDIIDDGPTYISMYDKVKARSCKNMQKQEEEKRQEKIKAKFSQLKQSRAKREEKKRSSWDEDSDSEHDVRRKPHKSSLESSSEDDSIIHSRKRDNVDFDDNKSEVYFSTPNDEEQRNKLMRKNSRTRIISDSSDDDISHKKTSIMCKSRDTNADMESSSSMDNKTKEESKMYGENMKKPNLINLFGKSDSDDNKLKSSLDNDTYKSNLIKSLCNDLSSENESTSLSRNTEIRKKHRKKQKKYRTYSEDDKKIENSDSGIMDSENKYKNAEKQRRHGSKKDKRRDKIRESNDTDESEKLKIGSDKKTLEENSEYITDIIPNNARREGKMEDIFGPLSDDSRDSRDIQKTEFSCPDYNSSVCMNSSLLNTDSKNRENIDIRRKKDKKRKLKRWLREDENSLDVDAVSKAIEERLFAETLTDEDNRIKPESNIKNDSNDSKIGEENVEIHRYSNKQDKLRKESKEKKKKKKRSREERSSKKEHDSYQIDLFDKSDPDSLEPPILETNSIPMLLDIPLPNDANIEDKEDDCKSLVMSPSLPRLTDSPPVTVPPVQETEDKINELSINKNIFSLNDKNEYVVESKDIEIEQIPMPPPYESIVPDISEIPLPADPEPTIMDNVKTDVVEPFIEEQNFKEQKFEEDSEKDVKDMEVVDNIPTTKLDKKVDEKPRAIISQEETADAVAALLGESFGGKSDTFSVYEETESSPLHQNDIESTILSTENIPEEDAEEMRQAVQNLNACEMEMKPETPVSDNDILLIDTDTEEVDETPQESTDKISLNIIRNTNEVINSNTIQVKTSEASTLKPTVETTTKSEEFVLPESDVGVKAKETDVKIQLARRENVQVITSTATPVITSWTLTGNKIIEPHVINLQPNTPNRVQNENKATTIAANVLQLKTPIAQNVQIGNIVKPVLTPTRVSTPYQVINHVVRPHNSNLQPPTIKIPESHILYQKPSGIVISPRINDSRMHSPKQSPQGETLTSPRLPNMAILTSTPQNINSPTVLSPNSMHQRSPAQVTVVRMQQPPLSPIQTLHMPHGARTMVSPNRPNSVLVQGTPLHFNRLPVTPVLTPITKQMNVNANMQQTKAIAVNTSSLIVQQKVITSDIRKNDHKVLTESKPDNAKIILSPSSLQSTNPTVMAQNRLITMQNAIQNMNSGLHGIGNKLVINNKLSPIIEKRDHQTPKSLEQINQTSFSTPIIHVAGVNNPPTSIIQSATKTAICSTQESNICKGQSSNIIHTLNAQRIITPVSLNAVKVSDPQSSYFKLESSIVKTDVSPTSLKTTTDLVRNNSKERKDSEFSSPNIESDDNNKGSNVLETANDLESNINKCETDFEELLKDNTNEIKVTNNPEKKLEINVGKTVTLIKPVVTISDKSNQYIEYNHVKKDPIEVCKPAEDNEKENLDQINEDHLKKEDTKLNLFQEGPSQNFKITAPSSNQDSVTNNPVKINTKNVEENMMEIKSENSFVFKEEIANLPICNDVNKTSETLNETKSFANSDKIIHAVKHDQILNDLNTESVIKKTYSLSKEIHHIAKNVNDLPDVQDSEIFLDNISEGPPLNKTVSPGTVKEIEEFDTIMDKSENTTTEKNMTSRRGGRSVRGRKTQKTIDRVQTRQISKPSRGSLQIKRGRGGRAKADKNPKNIVNCSASLPGDVYDFHEDSGDETSSSKTESRPRLILTIKSPLSGHAGVTATSTLSITQKDQCKTSVDKINKDEKVEDFVSPLANTRKSRRLLEKDVSRGGTADDEEGVGSRGGKRRPARQGPAKVVIPVDKQPSGETRKSPRGTKRSRDRSLSDASIDSGDGDNRRDELGREPKVARLEERPGAAENSEPAPAARPAAPPSALPQTCHTIVSSAVVGPAPSAPSAPTAPTAPPVVTSTPITKPPKKMISEISAKLAGVLEGGAGGGARRAPRARAAAPRAAHAARLPQHAYSLQGCGERERRGPLARGRRVAAARRAPSRARARARARPRAAARHAPLTCGSGIKNYERPGRQPPKPNIYFCRLGKKSTTSASTDVSRYIGRRDVSPLFSSTLPNVPTTFPCHPARIKDHTIAIYSEPGGGGLGGAAAGAAPAARRARAAPRALALARRPPHHVRSGVRALAAAGARRGAAAARAARAAARVAGAARGRLAADAAPAVPGDVAGAAGAEERLGGGADALRGRQPGRGGRHAGAALRAGAAAAAHRAEDAPRARAARPGAPQDEDGERALHPAGAAVRARPHGRAAAVHQPDGRLHHVPAAQAGRRHRQHRAAWPPPGHVHGAHLPVVRLRQREPDAHRARPHAPRGRHRAPAHRHRHRVTTTAPLDVTWLLLLDAL